MLWQDRIAPHEAAGYLVGVPVTCMALAIYLSHPALFGQSPQLWLFTICGLGAAFGFALYVGPVQRAAAFVSGIVAGLCGVAFFLEYGRRFHEGVPWLFPLSWPEVTFFVGSLPGVAMLGLLRWLLHRRTSA